MGSMPERFTHNSDLSGKGLRRYQDLQHAFDVIATGYFSTPNSEISLQEPKSNNNFERFCEILRSKGVQMDANNMRYVGLIVEYSFDQMGLTEKLMGSYRNISDLEAADLIRKFTNFRKLYAHIEGKELHKNPKVNDINNPIVQQKLVEFCSAIMENDYLTGEVEKQIRQWFFVEDVDTLIRYLKAKFNVSSSKQGRRVTRKATV